MHLLQRVTSLSVCCSLVLDELFVLIPRHQILINSHYNTLCMSVPPPLQQLSITLITFFLSVLHKLDILSASALPTTSARSRLLSLPPSLCVSLLLWLLSHSQVHVSIM